jgi:hypothetical protein
MNRRVSYFLLLLLVADETSRYICRMLAVKGAVKE